MKEIKKHTNKSLPKRDSTMHSENIALVLNALLGTNVVNKSDFDKVNKEKQELLNKIKNIDHLKIKLIKTECKLQTFVKYHSQWRPTTREFEKRVLKLNNEKLYFSFVDYPIEISANMKEAYNCYINGLSMACYIMILRTIEISINLIYYHHNSEEIEKDGVPKFVNVKSKLNWVKNKYNLKSFDYNLAKTFIETRNEVVHEVFTPKDVTLLSAFSAVIELIINLNNIYTKH